MPGCEGCMPTLMVARKLESLVISSGHFHLEPVRPVDVHVPGRILIAYQEDVGEYILNHVASNQCLLILPIDTAIPLTKVG